MFEFEFEFELVFVLELVLEFGLREAVVVESNESAKLTRDLGREEAILVFGL
tara:strand:- start:58 stop:213 length:156 start_codon:yes stop_codon:yes gene_type:complete